MIEKTATLVSAAVLAATTPTANGQDLEAASGQFVATYLVRKKDSMSFDAFRKYQLETHATLALALPGLRHYRLTLLAPGENGRQAFDAIAQVSFDSAEAYQAAMASVAGGKALADLPNMLDMDAVVVLSSPSDDIYDAKNLR